MPQLLLPGPSPALRTDIARIISFGCHLVQKALLHLAQDQIDSKGMIGSIISEAPEFKSVEELSELAGDRELWNGLGNLICPK